MIKIIWTETQADEYRVHLRLTRPLDEQNNSGDNYNVILSYCCDKEDKFR